MGYTPNIVTGVWVGNDDNTVMNKSIQGGTVPALIWKDVMKVATEPYGSAEFNYPEIKLVSMGDSKVIGDEEENNEKNTENQDNNSENSIMTPEEISKQVNTILNKADTQRPAVPSQSTNQQSTPKPAPAPKPAQAPVPIPMAVPEGMH